MAALALSLLALATTALSSPVQPLVTGTEGVTSASGVQHGALAIKTNAPLVANIASPPQYLTISVINSYGAALSTAHASNYGGPGAVSGNVGASTLAAGATAAFAVPTGWAGNVAIVPAEYSITGDDSLIEASFVVPNGYSVAVADVDISYVNGFSVPISCSCSGTVVSGCTYNLFAKNSCPNNDGEGSCANPERASTTDTTATTFFAPCAGMAYTFPNDNAANSFGACQSGVMTCCVGTSCPPNPKQ